ncbi:hypothetical protein LG275_02800 [Chryseomicrobium palamuruense]
MAFGITRDELVQWKSKIQQGEIAFLTHYWMDPRFPGSTSVTKVGAQDIDQLAKWGEQYGLKEQWIDRKESYPHFDLFGEWQEKILRLEGIEDQYAKFVEKKDRTL